MGWEGKNFEAGTLVKITLEDDAIWYGYFQKIMDCRTGSRREHCLIFSTSRDGAPVMVPCRVVRSVTKHELVVIPLKPPRSHRPAVSKPKKSAA